MKKTIIASVLGIFMFSCNAQKNTLEIPAQQRVVLDYPDLELFAADLNNKSFKGIEVSVRSKQTDKQVKGFGLSGKGKATVMVEKANQLVLLNSSNSTIKVSIVIRKADPKKMEKKGKYISFTLKNTSSESIPLRIPTVMNPNLSPFSKSGVDLKVGQEIFFKVKGKKYLLLKVNDKIKDGDILDIPKLIKKRKKELGIS